ncbi:MAG: hypothetical protein CSA26_09435 [Desulfobacterales bacterium]|nr:MAG: hypothetical protein CSA26_09435 [Desulfobacterales bacterium]
MSPYDEAHLYVAAIRVVFHKKQVPPTIEDICELLAVSVEEGLSVCRRLAGAEMIAIAEDPFSIKLSIGDHLKIEKLPKDEAKEDALAREIEQFMNKKQDFDKKVDTIKADLERKRQRMHNDIEQRLQQEMKRMRDN